ncbi:MAG: DMT family transporter [Thermoplasmata archaeon]
MKKISAYLLLILDGIIWGSTFPIIKIALDYTSPYIFLSLRFIIGSAIFFIIFRSKIIKVSKETVMFGLIIGIALFFGYYFQTVGLLYTTASHSGLITGLYVIIAPILAFFMLKEKINIYVIVAIVMALAGLILLTGYYSTHSLNFGDILTIFSAISYAFQVVLIDKYVKFKDPIPITFYQIFLVAILSSFLTPFNFKIILNFDLIFALIFTAIVATAIAIYIQTNAQKYLSSAEASIFLTSEPIFAMMFSYILLNETLGIISIIGAVMIVSSMILIAVKK